MASTALVAWKTRPPLYCEVEYYLRKPVESHDALHGGICSFYACTNLMMSRELGDDFRSGSSMSQVHSWRILYDWWVNDIMVRARQRGSDVNDENLGSSMMDANDSSREQSSMNRLWQKEFVRKNFHEAKFGKPLDMLLLQESRWYGSFTYARQRLAKSEIQVICIQPHIGPRPLTAFPTVLGATPDPCPWLGLKPNGLQTPHYLWNVKQHRTIVPSRLGPHLTYLAISHTWGRWKIDGKTTRIGGVPWAVPQNSRFDVRKLPYLLTRLPFSVEYIWIDLLCIPQHNSRPEFESIKRQEISRQASIFSGAACAMAWLNDVADWRGLRQDLEWLSLRYCKLFNSGLSKTGHIPDMGVTEAVLEEKLNSAMSRVETSNGLCDGLRLPNHGFLLRDHSSWFSSLWTLQEAFLRPDMLLCNNNFDVLTASKGFYVTFDMIQALMDAFDGPDGVVDSLVGASSEHFLNNVVRSNTDLIPDFSSLWPDAPQTVLTLHHLCFTTRLWKGMRNSPAVALSLASTRSCTGRRAEAIMSVIGAIDWYQSEGAAESPTTPDSMLGMYPVTFVLEVRDKLGGMFFLSGTLNWSEMDLTWPGSGDLADEDPPSETEKGITRGTMLPFSLVIISPTVSCGRILAGSWAAASDKELAELDISGYCAMMPTTWVLTYGPGYVEHPTIKTWTLRRNGNVLIESAAIEFSIFGPEEKQSSPQSDDLASHEDRGDIDRLEVPSGYTFRAMDFVEVATASHRPLRTEKSLEGLCFPGSKHAVCVGEYSDNQYHYRAGVILGGQYVKSSKYYVRIGYYHGRIPLQAKQIRPVPTQKVDWLEGNSQDCYATVTYLSLL